MFKINENTKLFLYKSPDTVIFILAKLEMLHKIMASKETIIFVLSLNTGNPEVLYVTGLSGSKDLVQSKFMSVPFYTHQSGLPKNKKTTDSPRKELFNKSNNGITDSYLIYSGFVFD